MPENLDLKIATLAELDQIVQSDCIIGSNSSSYKSSELISKVDPSRRNRVCNIHYTMPPNVRLVELMTDGETDPEIFNLLTRLHEDIGMLPATARKESTGFIFNRLWAAVKRECLTIVAEGVSDANEIDKLWNEMFHKGSLGPFAMMDQVGLDTVSFIEQHYIKERHLDSTNTVDWLKTNYLDQGKLGAKSGKGGFYPPGHAISNHEVEHGTAPVIYALDVGMGSNVTDIREVPHSGRVLAISATGKSVRELITGLPMPDGIQISVSTNRMFFTNMGYLPSDNNGSIMSANLDGSDLKTIIPEGEVHTPKQLVIDEEDRKVYFCDREGLRIHRCGYDGSQHEILVRTGDFKTQQSDQMLWCVGITIDKVHGHLYWTQKGASKAGQGRIFRANLEIPAGESADTRSDIELLFEHLPEPIDLEILPETQTLYWTDRGELPLGNSLNKAYVGGDTAERKKEILARHLNEAIGLKFDGVNQHIYVADMGGSVYRFNLDGSGKEVVYSSEGAITGIDLDFVNH